MKATLHQVWALWLLAALLAGCSQFGLITPKIDSVKDGVAVSYATIDAGAQVTTSLLQEGTIDADGARFSQSILERAYTLTTIAERETLSGKPDSAQEILATVSRLLGDVQQYLGRDFK